MKIQRLRAVAGALSALMLVPVTGCGTQDIQAQSPYGERTRGEGLPPHTRQGMSTKQKALLLAGAAAVYYLYQKHKNKAGEGPDGRYYLSKNGRVYYRNLKTGEYQWVDPPRQPIQVPAEEYERYTGRRMDRYQGEVIREAPADWPGNRAYRGRGGPPGPGY